LDSFKEPMCLLWTSIEVFIHTPSCNTIQHLNKAFNSIFITSPSTHTKNMNVHLQNTNIHTIIMSQNNFLPKTISLPLSFIIATFHFHSFMFPSHITFKKNLTSMSLWATMCFDWLITHTWWTFKNWKSRNLSFWSHYIGSKGKIQWIWVKVWCSDWTNRQVKVRQVSNLTIN
jgi:hypothetical protein